MSAVLHALRKAEQFLINVVEWVSTLLFSTMTIVMLVQIFVRKVLNRPFVWAEDLNVFVFVWLTFLGAAVLYSRRQLIVVDVINSYVSPRVSRILDSLVDLVVAAGAVYLTRLNLDFLRRQMMLGHKLGGALGIPSWTLTLSLVVGVALMVLSAIGFLLRGVLRVADDQTGGAAK